MTFDDVGPPGSAESGNGVLDTIGIEDVGFVTGLNALGLAGVSHTDPDGGTHLPDAIGPGMVCPGTPCGNPTDMQFDGQAISLPPVIAGGIDATVNIGRSYQNLGPAGIHAGTISSAFSLPAGCTVDGSSGNPSVSDPVGALGLGATILHQKSFALICNQPAASQISVTSCIDGDQVDLVPAKRLRYRHRDIPHGRRWRGLDRPRRIRDTSLRGRPQRGQYGRCDRGRWLSRWTAAAGAFSEAQFNIGTDPNEFCGTDGNPADFVGSGIQRE